MTIRLRAAGALVAAAWLLAAPSAAAGSTKVDPRHMDAIARKLQRVQQEATGDYLRGDGAAALARLEAIVDKKQWPDLLALANMTWVSHPAQSLQWHEQAYALSGHDKSVLLELAYHYTRRDECDKAIDAWKVVDRAGMVGGYMPMLVGYCHLKLGQDAQAFAMFERAEVGGHSGRFEHALDELWGGPPPMVRFAGHAAAFKADGNEASFHEALEIASGMSPRDRGRAMQTLADAAQPYAARLQAAPDLACLRPVFQREAQPVAGEDDAGDDEDFIANIGKREQAAKERKAAWSSQLKACKLVIEGNGLPRDPTLARALVGIAMEQEVATPQALLATHGPGLDARARSVEGDLPALELLAGLQAATRSEALAASDELGWSRYKNANFAASAVAGAMIKAGKPTPELIATLQRAHADFPDNAFLLEYWLTHGQPTEQQARAGWKQLALLQFHKPTGQSAFQFGPSASTLFKALGQYRTAAGL
jgi:hypothetical protein